LLLLPFISLNPAAAAAATAKRVRSAEVDATEVVFLALISLSAARRDPLVPTKLVGAKQLLLLQLVLYSQRVALPSPRCQDFVALLCLVRTKLLQSHTREHGYSTGICEPLLAGASV
jgi:hypothetical protein